jgi:hypothetical protein
MSHDHEFLVGRKGPNRHPAVAAADAATPGGIGGKRRASARAKRLIAHLCSDFGRVLANAADENAAISEPSSRTMR